IIRRKGSGVYEKTRRRYRDDARNTAQGVETKGEHIMKEGSPSHEWTRIFTMNSIPIRVNSWFKSSLLQQPPQSRIPGSVEGWREGRSRRWDKIHRRRACRAGSEER